MTLREGTKLGQYDILGPAGGVGKRLMTDAIQSTVSRLVHELQSGNRAALDELFPLIYYELRGLAHRQRRRWRGDTTLNTTALVHELYLKLDDQKRTGFKGRAHFFAVAAKAMRH